MCRRAPKRVTPHIELRAMTRAGGVGPVLGELRWWSVLQDQNILCTAVSRRPSASRIPRRQYLRYNNFSFSTIVAMRIEFERSDLLNGRSPEQTPAPPGSAPDRGLRQDRASPCPTLRTSATYDSVGRADIAAPRVENYAISLDSNTEFRSGTSSARSNHASMEATSADAIRSRRRDDIVPKRFSSNRSRARP
jgi:hypothetical protein